MLVGSLIGKKVDIMNIKINTICFILLLFLLMGVACATDSDNETLQKTIEQPDNEIPQTGHGNSDIIGASIGNDEKLELKVNNTELEAKASTTKTVKKTTTFKTTTNKVVGIITDGKLKVTIKAPNVNMHYKDGTKFTVTLKDEANKVMKKAKVKININGQTYTKTTDSKGKASISLNFKSGKYSVTSSFDETKTHHKKSVKSTVTIKSTIKCSDFSKYYKNNAAYYSTFYDKKGKLLKESSVKFKVNSKSYTVKTNKKGVGKLNINLNPGTYSISSINSKTSETVSKKITIKSILETHDLTMNEKDGSKFNVKVLNSNGKVSPNKKVTLKVNGKTYTPKSNSNGIASQSIDLRAGKYTITTEYEGLKNINKITINKVVVQNTPQITTVKHENPIKKTEFIHSTTIPNYVNVTIPYAFHNAQYTIKTGNNGTVKMPKVEVFTVDTGSKVLKFATGKTNVEDVLTMEYKSYLIPFDTYGLVCSVNKDSLNGNGIMITRTPTSVEIDYRDTTADNTELFGFYADKGADNSETFTYLKNDKIMAKVNVQTQYYDETGVKFNLAKLYNRVNTDFNYYEILNHVSDPIVFTNTGKPVTYSYFTNFIAGYQTLEDITTKFTINGREELVKQEHISYGRDDKYRNALGFEVIQSYSIINEKITKQIMEKWVNKNSVYLTRYGVMNVYGMHLASLETAWIADEIADNYAKDLNVNWIRDHSVAILGGINLDNTYLHILNADMGMNVTGDNENVKIFRLMNSVYLPNIEGYVLKPVGERYWDNVTSSMDNILDSVENNQFSIVQMGEMFYILSENNENSTIIINSTSGVGNVLLIDDDFAYKGAAISTICDCCSVGTIPKDIIKGIKNDFNKIGNAGGDIINNILNKIHPLSILGYMVGNLAAGIAGKLMTSGVTLTLSSTVGLIMGIHTTGNYIKNNFVEKNDWHYCYEHITFTRDGYMQNKKFFNIPNNDGTYDYIEVGINSDGSLNREDALYVSSESTKKLTKNETYKYFTEETWTPYNIPYKYQKYKIP